jgi:hypothetical protein
VCLRGGKFPLQSNRHLDIEESLVTSDGRHNPEPSPSITCTYCNQSFISTEITAHMDKCAAEAIAEYER